MFEAEFTMPKESKKLDTARDALRKAEKLIGNAEGVVHLRSAIDSLSEVMSGDAPQIEKDLAKKLVLTCKSKLLSEFKDIFANNDSHSAESIQHWNTVMEVFADAGLGDDPELISLTERLFSSQRSQSLDSFAPAELDIMEKELRAALNSLSDHRSRLSNLRREIQK
jgi:hypothetical protein